MTSTSRTYLTRHLHLPLMRPHRLQIPPPSLGSWFHTLPNPDLLQRKKARPPARPSHHLHPTPFNPFRFRYPESGSLGRSLLLLASPLLPRHDRSSCLAIVYGIHCSLAPLGRGHLLAFGNTSGTMEPCSPSSIAALGTQCRFGPTTVSPTNQLEGIQPKFSIPDPLSTPCPSGCPTPRSS